MSDIEKSVKVIPFTEKSDWRVWSRKFTARAYIKGYKDVLIGEVSVPKHDAPIDVTTSAGKDQMKARKANDLAYSDLLLSFEDIVNFALIDEATTTDHPEGDAAKAWKNLLNKHEPNTSANKVQLKGKFQQSRLNSVKNDPEVWVANLEKMRQQLRVMGDTMTEEDLIIHIINNLPKEYENLTDSIELDLDDEFSKINIEEVKKRLRSKFNKLKKRLNISDAKDGNGEEESALFVKAFKGRCHSCGKWGHKGSECQEKAKDTNLGFKQSKGHNGKPKFDGECNYCKKYGHREVDCFKKKREQGKPAENANASFETKTEIVLTVCEVCSLVDEDDHKIQSWVGDSGASSHMVNSLDGVTDVVHASTTVKIGDSTCMEATKRGRYKGTVMQADGSETAISMDVLYVPDLWINLFSITAALSKGASLSNDKDVILVTYQDKQLKFDRKSSTGSGHTMGVLIKPTISDEHASLSTSQITKRIDVNVMHSLLGHPSEAKTRATCKHFGISCFNNLVACEFCKLGKAHQTKLKKFNANKSTVPLQRVFIDICPIKSTSMGNKRNWLLIVDEATKYKWSHFLSHRSDVVQTMVQFFRDMKNEKHPVAIVRCDNAGENTAIIEAAKSSGFYEIKFEFTAPGTPQQNGVVERSFPTLLGRVRAMMNQAGFTRSMRNDMWAECARTATMLENAMPGVDYDPPVHRLYGKQFNWIQSLRVFGEIAVVKNIEAHPRKLDNKGKIVMFLGYPDNHPSKTYRFLNLGTKRIIISRDVSWLDKMWNNYMNITEKHTLSLDLNEEHKDEDTDILDVPDEASADDETIDLGENIENEVASNNNLHNALKKLNTFYNVTIPPDNDENFAQAEVAFMGATDSGYNEPESFKQAWNHSDTITKAKWRDAITKEIKDMTEKGVWSYQNSSSLPKSRKLIGSKWVFKVKKNGVHRARLVALGYSQIPGVDYTENFAPVINDVTFRIILLLMLIKRFDAEIIDVETAFLYGTLEEEIYMKVPEGLSEIITVPDGTCLKVLKSLYGLVQAARQWWKTFLSFLVTKLGYTRSEIDPCLVHKQDANGYVYICIYVDDALIVGDNVAKEAAIAEISKEYSIKRMGNMDEYIGCTIQSHDQGKLYLSQPDLIKKLQREFKVDHLFKYVTPGPPGEVVVRPDENDKLVSGEAQREYRKGVGMLLYLIKHSRPEISNAVRELAKVMDGATEAHMKNLFRTIKYVIDTKNVVLCLYPTVLDADKWVIDGICDSDYAGDKNTRISTTGYLVYVNGALVSWKSKGQRGVTLSSTEAEYVALSELCCEIMFVKMVIESIGCQVITPIRVQIDNIGAMFLASNTTTGKRTKHIDVRYHFVKNLVSEGIIELQFVKSNENKSDIYTKNVGGELFEKHTKEYMVMT